MTHSIDLQELKERIALNFKRFDDHYYRIEGIFQEKGADWPGDKEGRALLAFVSHYRISGEKIPCMEPFLAALPEKTDGKMYFESAMPSAIVEQQLSGHNWMLRGLCEHYEAFHDDFSLKALMAITEALYLPMKGRFEQYPTERNTENKGGVSGTARELVNGWLLSSDTGSVFMSVDGLSHVYAITKDERVLALLEEMTDVFTRLDKVGMKLQTHCSLTAGRGMMRLYQATKDPAYLEKAKAVFHLYVNGGGMTKTYQNLNWWGRPETWTEPCAVIDSLMLGMELFKVTGEESYRRLAVRIWLNGLATAQRDNGGAGTDKIVLPGQPYLAADCYEAYFCCTMRLAEGLRYVWENKDLMTYESGNGIEKDEFGRYFDGDLLLSELEGEAAEKYSVGTVEKDGHKLVPIPKYYRIPKAEIYQLRQRILFD